MTVTPHSPTSFSPSAHPSPFRSSRRSPAPRVARHSLRGATSHRVACSGASLRQVNSTRKCSSWHCAAPRGKCFPRYSSSVRQHTYVRMHIRHTPVPACAEATRSSTTKVQTRMPAGWATLGSRPSVATPVPYTWPYTRATSAPGLALGPATSALGLGSPLGTSAPGVRPHLPHLRRDWAEGQSKHARLHHGPSDSCSANETGVCAR
jgi:hypothetical protein